ncbi:MAG: undecaprenyl/decaprenyl-phosphate alpha-N-acetylglucosaminyl 1-phosphate transferase [Crocinitomicaceae bacterium]|nr:undecaprenyl/decaprenyl-phosphate alpha-N-acetylglucosaminyl 1-phosphate transferase [Crocinitomicaceae bacterium]
MNFTFYQILLFTLGGFVASFIVNSLLLNFSQSLGIRNKNDVTIRWSNQSKPSLGGISFFAVFIFFALAHSIVFKDTNVFLNRPYVGLITAGSLAFLMGLADDAYNTRPMMKLFIQIVCGAILVYSDSIIHLTNNIYIDSFITIFWVVLLMNSLNMLDNMDGITGTVVLFIVIACLTSDIMLRKFDTNIFILQNFTMIGGIIAFLIFNINPSKLFMGDAGSQFISLYVAFTSIDSLWMVNHSESTSFNWIAVVIVGVCFTAAFSDTLTVVINRLKKGQSPMVGGKDHTTHHLVYAGLTDRQVWYVFLLIACIGFLLSIYMIHLVLNGYEKIAAVFGLFTATIFILLYRNTLKHPQK